MLQLITEGKVQPLVRLIKCNAQMADEQVKKMITDFTAMRDKCCKQTDTGTYLGEEVNQVYLRPLPKSDNMKWRTTIHVILLVSLTVVKALTQSYWETVPQPQVLNYLSTRLPYQIKMVIDEVFTKYFYSNCLLFQRKSSVLANIFLIFKRIILQPCNAMIMFAQYLRGGTFGKAVKMAEDITDLAKRCAAANRDNTDCLEPLQFSFTIEKFLFEKNKSLRELSFLPLPWSASSFYQAPKVLKPIKEDSLRQEYTCGILNKFGERTLKALKLAQISQTFPKADFVTINKLVMDIANMHKDCCCGDMLDCMHDRERILYYVCTNQDIISSKIKKVCEKPLLQRSLCMNIPGDTLNFSAQMLLRTGKGYKDLLKECCKTGCPADCCSRGVSAIVIHTTHQWIQEEELRKHIYETESVMKTSCNLYKEKGDYYFQNEYYFFRYLHYSHTSWAQPWLD
ncbi:hypothetical protein Q9233_000625 [Columba guinea]|nr:hypothetical protein Q9233_000625 [Columba guinea]